MHQPPPTPTPETTVGDSLWHELCLRRAGMIDACGWRVAGMPHVPVTHMYRKYTGAPRERIGRLDRVDDYFRDNVRFLLTDTRTRVSWCLTRR